MGSIGSSGKTSKPRALAVFYLTGAVGALLFAMPHFMTSKYRPQGGVGTPLCSSTGASNLE